MKGKNLTSKSMMFKMRTMKSSPSVQTRGFFDVEQGKSKPETTERTAMKPSTPKTELSRSTQLRKIVFGGSLKVICFGFALGLAFLSTTAFADVAGFFKFDNFPGDNANFTDDSGKGLRGLLGFPFSQPGSVPGPAGLPGDHAVDLDLNGGLAVDDSAAQILNFVKPPLTLECWVRSTNDTQIGRHRAFISYGIPGGPPVAGLVR